MSNDLLIRNMRRDEVGELVEWAALEGWNPGLNDADIFWANDPEAFIAAELDGELIGGGAITSYAGAYGFMGFFIIRPEFRGHGFGNTLWHARRDRLLARLNPGASIGMDGVFNMQDYYARGGFHFSHRNIRYQALIAGDYTAPPCPAEIIPLSDIPFAELEAYDRKCFPAPRSSFLKAWITQADSLALGYRVNGKLQGYGVARRCRLGYKIGPLFADSGSFAKALYLQLAGIAAGGPLFLDAPEHNEAAHALIQSQQMVEVFGCARMYFGPNPRVDEASIFGVTTF